MRNFITAFEFLQVAGVFFSVSWEFHWCFLKKIKKKEKLDFFIFLRFY